MNLILLMPVVRQVIFLGLLSVTAVASAKPCEEESGKILRAMFTTGIENREPVDQVLVLENRATEVYFYTDLSQFQGRTITHRWEFEGRVVHQRNYEVKGPRWRVSSRKDLDPAMVGRWTVVVLDEHECPLKAVVFQYVQYSDNQKQTAILPASRLE